MVNYPFKKAVNSNQVKKKDTRRANLGMFLEDMINETNEYYLNADIAIIHKKPTPVQIVKVDYPSREHAVITEAYYKVPSTTDYNGIYKGKYIDFEAKETNSNTSFSLANVHPHQVTHLESIIKHGGIGFLIVCFKHLGETYLLPFEILNSYWLNKDKERKSIPYQEFKDHAYLIPFNFKPKLDYLKIIDEVYFEGK